MSSLPDSTLPAASLVLEGLRFVRLGESRVGGMLADLLAGQGAQEDAAAGDMKDMDVVIDDRTQAADAGADAERWRAAQPGLVCLRYTDFPRTHPRWSERSTLLDEMIHAELGLNRMQAEQLRPEPLPMASAYGAIWGAVYIAASLAARDRTGRGSSIEFPLFSAGLTVMARRLLWLEDERLVDPITVPHLPLAEIYACADGRHVQSQGHSARFVEAMLEAGGHLEWRDAAVAGLHQLPDRASEAMWSQRLAALFRQHPAQHWEDAINARGGACTVCRTAGEWIATDHARRTNILAAAANGVAAGPGVRIFSAPATGAPVAGTIPAAPAARTADAAPAAARLPLAGVRVIDFAIILAGPTCGRTLAELGAEVIKVDAAVRPTSMYGWLDVNRGKRSIAIDLKQPAGRELALRLIAGADVVVENFRAGKMDKLGLGFGDAVRHRKDIVYASLNAFDYGGPWSGRAGWEHNAQAASGMQVARARGGVPEMVPVPVNDYSTGLLGAYGVLLALRRARTTGSAVRVTGSLARSATFIRSADLAAYGHGSAGEPARTQAIRCTDGWVRAEASPRLDSARNGLAALDCATALARLRALGVAAVLERTLAELQADTILDASGQRLDWRHPRWGRLQQIAARPAVSDIGCDAGRPASDPGADGDAILAGLGCSASEIARLKASGVVGEPVPLFAV